MRFFSSSGVSETEIYFFGLIYQKKHIFSHKGWVKHDLLNADKETNPHNTGLVKLERVGKEYKIVLEYEPDYNAADEMNVLWMSVIDSEVCDFK